MIICLPLGIDTNNFAQFSDSSEKLLSSSSSRRYFGPVRNFFLVSRLVMQSIISVESLPRFVRHRRYLVLYFYLFLTIFVAIIFKHKKIMTDVYYEFYYI